MRRKNFFFGSAEALPSRKFLFRQSPFATRYSLLAAVSPFANRHSLLAAVLARQEFRPPISKSVFGAFLLCP
jgi:hypothetical protein